MRKILFLIPLLVICTITTNSYAITQEECDDATSQEECPAGCYWDRTGCKVCGLGTYTTKAGQTECAQCSHPTKGSWEWADESTGHTANDCPWTTTCEYNEYWDISGIINGSNFGCEPCGEHYNSKQTNSYPISGAGIISTDGLQYLKGAVCDGKVYKLDLRRNTWFLPYQHKKAYVKFDEGFAANANSDDWDENYLPQSAVPGDRPIKSFKGYNSNENCNGIMFFAREESNGTIKAKFNENWNSLFNLTDSEDEENTKQLFMCWENLEVTINYLNPSGGTWKVDKYTMDDDTSDSYYQILQYGGPVPDGGMFSHYTCTYIDTTGAEKTCTKSTVTSETTDFVPDGTTVNLKPNFGDCPDGYWCQSGSKNPCPAGTTSAGGAASEENCYMVRGNNGTRFCDSNGCFFLPGLGNISFNPDAP